MNACSTVCFLCVSGSRTKRENVYLNIHLQDALIDGLSPNRVNRANSSCSPSEVQICMNDDESVRSTSVEQGCEISQSPALFLLNHFSFVRDNHVSQRSVKLMVNTSDCTSTMRIKEDQNKHLNGKGLSLGAPHCRTKEMSGQVVSFGD